MGDNVLPVLAGVRTELTVPDGRDASALDPVIVQPLPSQSRVLAAFGELGAMFVDIDFEATIIPGVQRELDFHQILEFAPHMWHTDRVKEVGLAFIASQRDLRVYLEARHGGRFNFGRTTAGQYFMTHEQAGVTDWTAGIGNWLAGVNR